MFAVFQTGGKQYRAAKDDVLTIGKIAGEPGSTVSFGEVLVLGGDTASVGAPTIAGASVAAQILRHERGDKVIAFKKRRRQNSKRKRGYRDELTVVRITDIVGSDGQSARAEPRAEQKPAAPAGGEQQAGEAGA